MREKVLHSTPLLDMTTKDVKRLLGCAEIIEVDLGEAMYTHTCFQEEKWIYHIRSYLGIFSSKLHIHFWKGRVSDYYVRNYWMRMGGFSQQRKKKDL